MGEGEEQHKQTDVPVYRAAHFSVQGTSNECHLLIGETFAVIPESGGLPDGARVVIAAILSMSPQSAKDLSIAMQQFVAQYENMYGQITTDFTKKSENGPD